MNINSILQTNNKIRNTPSRMFLSTFFALLISLPSFANANTDLESTEDVKSSKINSKSLPNSRYGTISWYGPRFHGKRTASGEIYNQNKLTAASNSLPFGTRVKVTCMVSGKSVIVRINDTGGFGKYGRVLDVSKAAAEALGFVGRGVTKVSYQVLN